jgi:hypothetical protein
MRSAEQCISKAEELEAMASRSVGKDVQDRFSSIAQRWRSMGVMALQQEGLEASLTETSLR